MYAARLRAYKKIGYELCVSMVGEKQKANAIYDMTTMHIDIGKIFQKQSQVL